MEMNDTEEILLEELKTKGREDFMKMRLAAKTLINTKRLDLSSTSKNTQDAKPMLTKEKWPENVSPATSFPKSVLPAKPTSWTIASKVTSSLIEESEKKSASAAALLTKNHSVEPAAIARATFFTPVDSVKNNRGSGKPTSLEKLKSGMSGKLKGSFDDVAENENFSKTLTKPDKKTLLTELDTSYENQEAPDVETTEPTDDRSVDLEIKIEEKEKIKDECKF